MSLLEDLPPPGPARERVIAEAIAARRVDQPTWVQVRCGRVLLTVSADYLSIDGGRVPMSAPNAQAAVDTFQGLLPTPKLVRAIEAAAREHGRIVPFVPWPRWQDNSQLERDTILWRERNIASYGAPAGEIVAGCLKDVVIAPRLAWMLDRVLIFGGLYASGLRVQELQTNATAHDAWFGGGYAHGVRCVQDLCELDGTTARVSEILRDPALAAQLSDDGALSVVRYPMPGATTATTAGAGTSTAISSRGTPSSTTTATTATLRRGDRGPAVEELQRLLASPADPVRDGSVVPLGVDGIFGPRTEAAVRRFQQAHGLEVDGIAGPLTFAALRAAAPNTTQSAELVPFIQARNFTAVPSRTIDLIVLHTMEAAEKPGTARAVANWFAGAGAPRASAHYCIDRDEVVQGVAEHDVAWAAPGANHNGIQLEHAGYASQRAADWSDEYSREMLARSAQLVAGICARWTIPIAFVDAAGLERGERGITTHAEVSRAFRRTTHTDPGASFPMVDFLELIKGGTS